MTKTSSRTLNYSLTALFMALILLFALTPIGFINLGIIRTTLIHVPVIIGAIVLGPRYGALLGLAFGMTSFFINSTAPNLLSFAFTPAIPVPGSGQGSWWALVICFIPRILTGIVPYYVFRVLTKFHASEKLALIISGVSGALVNTLLVMNLIYFLFRDAYAAVKNIAVGGAVYKAILAVIFVNGVPEAIIAALAAVTAGSILLKLKQRKEPLKG